jgi:hypothetical protein
MWRLCLIGMLGMSLACADLSSGPDVRVRGIVLRADGGPASDTIVTIDRGAEPVQTGTDGRFEFGLSLDDAIYSDEGEHAAPLHVRVGDFQGLNTEAVFTVDRSGTVELPPLAGWVGSFAAFDGGIATPRPELADLAAGYTIYLDLHTASNEYRWYAEYAFDGSTPDPVLPLDPDVLEGQSASVELSAQAAVGQTSLTQQAAPFTLSAGRIPLSRGAPCDVGQTRGPDAGPCPYTDGQFPNSLSYTFVPYIAIQLPSPVVVSRAIVHDLSGASDCTETLDTAADAGFTELATFEANLGGNDVVVPLPSGGPVSVVRLRCVQPDGGTRPFALTELSIF